MKTTLTLLLLTLINVNIVLSQSDEAQNQPKPKITLKDKKETNNFIGINLLFSDNGFGLGATLYKQISPNLSGFAGIFFSGSKDNKEFEQIDIFGNSYTPDKVNRLFMVPINLGLQLRLFKDDVTDNMRPFINFGITPTAIIYTPYDKSFFPSWGYARAQYTVGGFVGVGMDYVSNRHSSLSLNVKYYYINLFGDGVNSISTEAKNFFGGIYFIFSYNFMH